MKAVSEFLNKKTSFNNSNKLIKEHSKAGYSEGFYSVSSYTPTLVASTPINTGIAVGGFGNSFHLTPIGTTPAMSSVPGYLIVENDNDSLSLLDFYIGIKKDHEDLRLEVKNYDWFMWFQKSYPLKKENGESWFEDDYSIETVNETIEDILNSNTFYTTNKECFERWKDELSTETKEILKRTDNYRLINYRILLDLYASSIGRNDIVLSSLTGNSVKKENSGIENYNAEKMKYRALFPFSEFSYQNNKNLVEIERVVFSPHEGINGEISTRPLNWNIFNVKNKSNKAIEITFLQSQENMCGYGIKKIFEGAQDAACELVRNPNGQNGEELCIDINDEKEFVGVRLFQDKDNGEVFSGDMSFGILADKNDKSIKISLSKGVYPVQKKDIIKASLYSGQIKRFDATKIQHTGREQLDGMICVNVVIQPGEIKELSFLQVLNFPRISIKNWESTKKYYNDNESLFENSNKLVFDACLELEKEIEVNIQSIEKSYNKLKRAIPNCSDSSIKKICELKHNQKSFLSSASILDKNDRYFIKECAEYPFFNSLDVYFYGSFMLFPENRKLDYLVQKEFAKATMEHDNSRRMFFWDAFRQGGDVVDKESVGVRSQKGAVIHDLGCTFDIDPDGYFWRNAQEWKDLAPKFILMVLRNYYYSKDDSILNECWEAIKASIEFIENKIPQLEVLPYVENGSGDTFDEIESNGVTIYCSSLWIAGLKAAEKIANIIGDFEYEIKYQKSWIVAEERMKLYLWDDSESIFMFYTTPIISENIISEEKFKVEFHKKYKGFEKSQPITITLNSFIYNDESIVITKDLCDKARDILKVLNLNNEYQKMNFCKNKLTRIDKIRIKKLILFDTFKDHFHIKSFKKILCDSDDIFADQLLADLYLEILDLECINSNKNKISILRGIMGRANKLNGVFAGISNVVERDGTPHNDLQAQEIWLGVQYSLAASMLSVGLTDEFVLILEKMHEILYEKLKMPFAAPEGIVVFGYITEKDISKLIKCKNDDANKILEYLKLKNIEIIDADNRLLRQVTEEDLNNLVSKFEFVNQKSFKKLFEYFKSKEINYTVGQYLRPGMIFSIDAIINKLLFEQNKL